MSVEYIDNGPWVKEEIILLKAPDTNRLEFTIKTSPGLQTLPNDGGLDVVDQRGMSVFSIPRPAVWDASNQVGAARFHLDDQILTLVVDSDFLSQAEYPVTIDPTFSGSTSFGSPEGRSLVAGGNRALMVWKGSCDGLIDVVCWANATYDPILKVWAWSTADSVSGGSVHDLWMKSSSEIYAVGTDAAGTTGLYWRVMHNGGTWSWGTPQTVAPISSNARLAVTATVDSSGADRVWIAYRGFDGILTRERLSYGAPTGTSWTHRTVAVSVQGIAQVLPDGDGIVHLGRQAGTPNSIQRVPISWGGTVGSAHTLIEDASIASFRVTSDRSVTTSNEYQLVYSSYDTGTNSYLLKHCSWSDSGSASCGQTVSSNAKVVSGARTYDIAVDNGWTAVAYIPHPSAAQNQEASVYRAFYEGEWSGEKVRDADPTGEVTLARSKTHDAFHQAWLQGSVVAEPLAVDHPAVVQNFDASPDPFSYQQGASSPTTFSSYSFAEAVSWTLDIKDAQDNIVRTFNSAELSTAAVRQDWDGQDETGTSVIDGTYTAELKVTDAFGWVTTAIGSVVLDATAPSPGTIIPVDGANTVFAEQPLVVSYVEELAGIAVDGATFVLTDVITGTSTNYSATSVGPGWARTDPVTLLPGATYRVEVTLTDRAGNSAQVAHRDAADGGGFFVTDISPTTTEANISTWPCSLSDADPPTQTKLATCTGVPLYFEDIASLEIGGSSHSGVGHFRQEVSLASAKVKNSQGDEVAAYSETDPAWGPQATSQSFLVQAGPAGSISVQPATLEISELTATVPASWTDASIYMPTTATQASYGLVCSDPIEAEAACTPDPIRDVLTNPLPQVAYPHVADCDSVISHKELIAPTASQDYQIDIAVDTTRLDVAEVGVNYSLDRGPWETISMPGNGAASYSLTISAAQLPEGKRINYAVYATGAFLDSACVSLNGAVTPSAGTFESLATNLASPKNEALWDSFGNALAMVQVQPGWSIESDPLEVCDSFFAPPTPCTINTPITQEPYESPSSPSGDLLFYNNNNAQYPNQCPTGYAREVTYNLANGYHMALTTYEKIDTDQTSQGVFDTAYTERHPDTVNGGNALLHESYTRSQIWPANPSTLGYSRVGWKMRPKRTGGPEIPGGQALVFDIHLRWSVRGIYTLWAAPWDPVVVGTFGNAFSKAFMEVDLGWRNLGASGQLATDQPDVTVFANVFAPAEQQCTASTGVNPEFPNSHPVCRKQGERPVGGGSAGNAKIFDDFYLVPGGNFYYFWVKLTTYSNSTHSAGWGANSRMDVYEASNEDPPLRIATPSVTVKAKTQGICLYEDGQ